MKNNLTMKKITIACLVLLAAGKLIAQTPAQSTPPQQEEFIVADIPEPPANTKGKKSKIYQTAEQMPQFIGGETALLKFLGSNIKYPSEAIEAGTQGTLFITFVITKKGKVENVQVLRGLKGVGAKACALEAVRVVKSMPKWKPGKDKGKKVDVQYNLPVKYTLR